MTRSEIIAIQSELGVKADGIWGPITALSDLYLGATPIQAAYLGSTLVWER